MNSAPFTPKWNLVQSIDFRVQTKQTWEKGSSGVTWSKLYFLAYMQKDKWDIELTADHPEITIYPVEQVYGSIMQHVCLSSDW